MDGDVVGTPAYMPLEQAAGRVSEVGPHSDVYALGAMLYHLIAGHMPYVPKGARLNNYAIWGLVQQGPPKEELAVSLEQLRAAVALWTKDDARANQADEESKLSARVADLERDVGQRRTFEFEDAQDRWWHAQLSKLVQDLKAFTDKQRGGLYSSGVSEKHGWGIVKRAEFARTIDERSVDGPEASRLWSEAIAGIVSSPKYGGLELTPQRGLLPIGMDPDSGLWEFAHLQTGEPAIRGADGKLLLTEETGLVFVLIPSGTFWMGAQKTDENGQNYDRQAGANESPVHEVTLSAYLLSKYEMTQGQWLRIAARNPSNYGPSSKFNGHQHDLTHPVEQVTWTACMELMERLGLVLPSEAQWENGCRAGTNTPWWTGAERESLRGKINLADHTAEKGGAVWPDIKDWPDLEDNWVVHAPVGSLAANAYGLHEVHGNVWEWCRDGYDNRDYSAAKQLDPVKPWSGASYRVFRGGSFINDASNARSANRLNLTPEDPGGNLGLRPAVGITP